MVTLQLSDKQNRIKHKRRNDLNCKHKRGHLMLTFLSLLKGKRKPGAKNIIRDRIDLDHNFFFKQNKSLN